MAWVERSGARVWRVRFREDGRVRSIPDFRSRKEAWEAAVKVEAGWRPESSGLPGPVVTLDTWSTEWFAVLDVDERTEENYRSLYRRHIQPRWGGEGLGDITSSAIEAWAKDLRCAGYAPATVHGIRQVLSMILADAADEGLIAVNPVRHHHRGRRTVEQRREPVWASPGEALVVAAQAAVLSTIGDGVLIVTAAWTGARWDELVGLQRPNLRLDEGRFWIDPTIGALHESAHRLWLGPPKTDASVRWVSLPPFLIDLLRHYLAGHDAPMVFPTVAGGWHRRTNFGRRVLRPAADGTLNCQHRRVRQPAGKPGLRFHGLRHGHKAWLIEDGIPEIAQAMRLGHVLDDRIRQLYSHVAPGVEQQLLERLQARYETAVETAPARVRRFLAIAGGITAGRRAGAQHAGPNTNTLDDHRPRSSACLAPEFADRR